MCKESACFLWVNRNYRNSREYSFLKGMAVMRRNFLGRAPTPALSPARGRELDYRLSQSYYGTGRRTIPL